MVQQRCSARGGASLPWIKDPQGIPWQLISSLDPDGPCDRCGERLSLRFVRPSERQLCVWCWGAKEHVMTTILKYELPIDGHTSGEFSLDMPQGAAPIHVGAQLMRDFPFMWVFANPALPIVPHRFLLVMDGEEFDGERWNPLGTVIFSDRYVVCHLLAEKGRE